MVLPGHISGGYLVTYTLLAIVRPELSANQTIFLYFLGMLSGEIPDIDLFKYYFDIRDHKTKKSSHRDYITHRPLFWLFIGGLILLLAKTIGSEYLALCAFIILLGTWSHFLFDSVEYGITWLWPFTNRRFGITNLDLEENTYGKKPGSLSYYWQYIKREYLKQITFYLEILVTALALYIAFWK